MHLLMLYGAYGKLTCKKFHYQSQYYILLITAHWSDMYNSD